MKVAFCHGTVVVFNEKEKFHNIILYTHKFHKNWKSYIAFPFFRLISLTLSSTLKYLKILCLETTKIVEIQYCNFSDCVF